MKKPKSLETKLRSAIRLIWSRSAERRAVIKQAEYTGSCHNLADTKGKYFNCPLCDKEWPIWAGEVDHEPAIGSLDNWRDIESFIDKMFFGPQRVVCKSCHREKTSIDRKNSRKHK